MTGRELIIYILENGMEDEPIFKDGRIVGLMTEVEAAINFGVGIGTIQAWTRIGRLKGIKIGNSIFYAKTIEDPRIEENENE